MNNQMKAGSHQDFSILLEFLKHNRGFDFTGYKEESLTRRIEKRMKEVEVNTYDLPQYLDVFQR